MSLDSAAAVGSSLVGQSIDGRYRLEAEIGVGGLGTVYRATHTKLDRAVAVKVLHESYGASAVQRARFEREAKVLATVEHTNIVSVMDYGVAEDRPYLVMELLEGETLSARLKRGPLPAEGAVSIAQQMLGALAFMHSGGLLHRDIKPSNVFIQRMHDGKERVKVLDFGLAKFTAPVEAGSDADPTLTRAGSVVGTPAYMSPEQATGETVDARGDVYAMGVILFQMLTGRLPFEGDAIDQVRAHLVTPVPSVGRISPDRRIDAALDAAVQRAMAKRREDRFANGAEMLSALVEIYPDLLSPYRSTFEISTVRPAQALGRQSLNELDASPSARSIPLRSRDLELASASLELEPLPPPSAADRLRALVRTLFRTSVRAVAIASVVSVMVAAVVLTLLLRSAPDRADLIALRERVSDRWLGRVVPVVPIATAPQQAAHPEASGAAERTGPGPMPSRPAGTNPPDALPPSAALPTAPGPAVSSTSTGAPEASPPAPAMIEAPPPPAALSGPPAPTGLPAETPARHEPASDPESAGTISGPPAARNPWLEPIPHELRFAHKLAANGGRASERITLALIAYNQAHPDDARGRLLLGELYLTRTWRKDAVTQFASALQLDLSARGAPELLPALLGLVIQGKVAAEAERVIVKTYGSEALDAIAAALSSVKDPKALARLRSLQVRLTKT